MAASERFVEQLKELLVDFAPVSVRRMFSGAGLFVDNVMFAIVVDDCLYLKADEESRRDFEAEGLAPFSVARQGRRVALSYWRAPERLLDDPEEMQSWATVALAVARSQGKKAAKRKRASSAPLRR